MIGKLNVHIFEWIFTQKNLCSFLSKGKKSNNKNLFKKKKKSLTCINTYILQFVCMIGKKKKTFLFSNKLEGNSKNLKTLKKKKKLKPFLKQILLWCLLWWVDLYTVVPTEVAEVRLLGVSHLTTEVGQFDGLTSELPLIPFVRLYNVWLVEVCVCLRATLTFRHGLFNHLARVFSLVCVWKESPRVFLKTNIKNVLIKISMLI